MKKIIIQLSLFIFSTLFGLSTFSQNWVWSGHASGTSDMENVTGIDLDNNGNVYVTGTFGAGAILNGSSLTTAGLEDIFVAKYTPSGTLAWVRTGGSTGKDLSRTIVVDELGNTYVTGLFVQTAGFDSLALNDKGSRTLISYGDPTKRDVFIAKFNTNGQMLWVKRVAWGPGNDVPEGLSIDVNNDLILSGTFKDSLFFSNTDTLLLEKSNINGYIAKYNSDGDCIWTKHTIHTNANTKFLNISAAVNDQIYLAGFLTDTMWVESFVITSRSVGSTDILLMKINEDGDIEWIRKAGSTGPDRGNSVYADPFGGVFISGYFTGTANFDSTDYNLYDSRDFVSKGGEDMFVAKYNNTGTLQWVGSNGSTGEDIGYGLYANDEITLSSGSFTNSVIFGKDTLTSIGGEETGIFVYDKNGAPIYGSSAAGDGEDRGAGLVFDESQTQTTIMGYFESTNLALPNLPALVNPTPGSSEGFVAAYDNPIRVSFVEQSDPLCNGTGSGYLVAQTFFGAEPITYSWSHDPLLNGPNATNLPAGTYKVVVEDATESVDSISVTLVDPSSIVNTVEETSILDLTCPEDNNGTIDLSTTGGAGGYTYTWSGTGSGICVNCQDQINLGPGEYYVEVEDLNGCFKQDTFTITRPEPITFGGSTVIDIKINDPGPDDPGAVNLVTNGGTPPYSYSWIGPDTTATSDTIDNLYTAGNYQVTVTDDSSCNADTTFLVRSDTAFVAYISFHQNVICKGANNGILEVEVENGTAPFTYDWRDQFLNPAGTTKRVENLPPNTYTVTVTDDNGKTTQASSQIKEPINTLSVTKAVVDPSCFGYCDGSIDLNVTGGWGEYTYLWTPGNITTEDLINICSGTYSCVVTDKEGCQFVTIPEIVVNDPELFVLDNISINTAIICAGDQTGELEAHHTGGTGPFTYQWDDANNQVTNPAILLAAREDPYNVTVTDFKGCKVEGNKLLMGPAAFGITSLSYEYPSSSGSSDASIIVHAEGGTSPYQYRLNNGALQSDSLFANLSPDTDTVFVVDNNMCGPAVKIFTIPDGPIVIDSIDYTNTNCAGENNDGICVFASGGLGTLNYQWIGGPSTQCYENLSTGGYTIVITDSNLVSIESLISVFVPPAFTLVQVDKTWDPSLGTVTVTISGGTPDYTYSLVGPSSLDSTTLETSVVFEDLPGGDYTISVVDANNCGPLQEPVNVSIDDFYIGGDLKLYPNPSTGRFTIEFENSEAGDVMLEILNVTGQMIYKKLHKYNGNSRFNETIDLGKQASGAYFMRINGLPVKAKLMIE